MSIAISKKSSSAGLGPVVTPRQPGGIKPVPYWIGDATQKGGVPFEFGLAGRVEPRRTDGHHMATGYRRTCLLRIAIDVDRRQRQPDLPAAGELDIDLG